MNIVKYRFLVNISFNILQIKRGAVMDEFLGYEREASRLELFVSPFYMIPVAMILFFIVLLLLFVFFSNGL